MSEYKIDYDKRFKRFYYHKDGKVIGMSDILETLNYQQTKIAELEQNTNKAKAASVRDSISYIEANFEYGKSDLYALLMQYAEKLERGKL